MLEDFDPRNHVHCLRRVKAQAERGDYRLAMHAEDERIAEETGLIEVQEILQAIGRGQIVENHPDDPRGPSCLIYGDTDAGRPLHVVCTTSLDHLFIITVYQPTVPDWITPTERGETP